jgi:purine-cytosine permease-like protein
MIFTHLGRIVAFILLLSGIFHIAGGLMIAAGWLALNKPHSRFFPTQSNNRCGYRQAYAVLFSIALGILTEISYSVRARRERDIGGYNARNDEIRDNITRMSG